jgi:hypothetical protein
MKGHHTDTTAIGDWVVVLGVDADGRRCWKELGSSADGKWTGKQFFLLSDLDKDGLWHVRVSEKALNGDCFIFRTLRCSIYVKPSCSVSFPTPGQTYATNPFEHIEFEVRDNPLPRPLADTGPWMK